MKDRELLELAAKAAGISDEKLNHPVNFWSPLSDDGDALRLAVKLGLTVEVFHNRTIAKTHFAKNGQLAFAMAEELGEERFIRTRRAIVRAAAEIGKQLDR